VEQLESPALGKPKETVEHQDGKIEAERMLDSMSTEELEELARSGRHLRALPQTHSWCELRWSSVERWNAFQPRACRGHRVLVAASVLGQPFDPEPLADLLGADATELTEELERLCEQRILRIDGSDRGIQERLIGSRPGRRFLPRLLPGRQGWSQGSLNHDLGEWGRPSCEQEQGRRAAQAGNRGQRDVDRLRGSLRDQPYSRLRYRLACLKALNPKLKNDGYSLGSLGVPMRSRRLPEGDRVRHVVLSDKELGESPVLPTIAILTSAALYATLPGRFVVGPSAGLFAAARWVVPTLTVVLLVALIATVPQGRLIQAIGVHGRHLRVGRRIAALAVTAVVSAANAAAILLLVHLLISGAHAQARLLLRAGIHMWSLNVLVFALWFWELDNGGPAARRTAGPEGRDFLFPQQASPELTVPDWQPRFLDYLYVSFTNATAFSPTDTMPLSRWAKMLMLLESAASLVLALMVAARAINILK
jgi:hypothetical protein